MEATQDKTPTLLMNQKSKVVLVDFGFFLHRSVFGWAIRKQIPATWTCLNMILSNLSKVGVHPDDTIIIAIDGRKNWRKDVDPNYKANRKDLRDNSGIDWPMWFEKFNELVEKLKVSTPFHFIKIDKLEADDIISVACRYYKDRECIILSTDSDFEQLCALKNVKIFSPASKKFKLVLNPHKSQLAKIKKERTDNLITEIKTEEDYQKRKMLINLLELPAYVEKPVLDILQKLEYNDFDLDKFPYESLISRLMDIYKNEDTITFEKSVKKEQKKARQKRKEKQVNVSYTRKLF